MKRLIKICVVSFAFLLSGCTALLWAEDPGVRTHSDYVQSATDTVRAFGRTQQQNNEQIVMMGEKYWYVLAHEHTDSLLKVLNTKLPKAFATADNKPFQVELSDNAKYFVAHFRLYYAPQNEREKKILTDLGFALTEDGKLYEKHYRLIGDIYQADKKIRQDYQFETALPIAIYVRKTSSEVVDPIKLIGKIALTPVTLAGDVVLMAVSWVLSPLTLK